LWVTRGSVSLASLQIPASPTVAQLQGIPDGPEGTAQTLRAMRQDVRNAVRSPSQTIRSAALQILQGLPARKWLREVLALHAFVRDQIRYVSDPVGVQIVQTPEKTLELGQGNCVQKSVLLSSLLESTGHPTRFVALEIKGQSDGQFSHVLVETKVGTRWLPLESIIPVPAGWYPPDAGKRYVLDVS